MTRAVSMTEHLKEISSAKKKEDLKEYQKATQTSSMMEHLMERSSASKKEYQKANPMGSVENTTIMLLLID